ncbi:hypothetical protein FISHEDRAFT_69658 [Fistulina hepatica ATCC 64428]|uniref:Uncharacterized protein n=1 Tax=Fistulina hepatica ATCC 64428 TaxID=1128425 RepID=A0A0D7AMV6_9AGAR|nr:hypothetical protein FISHEDRAFT_69658 [Fistulina hepatica ATCC 64428]
MKSSFPKAVMIRTVRVKTRKRASWSPEYRRHQKQWENPDVTADRTWYTGEKPYKIRQHDNSRFDSDPAVETSSETRKPPSQMVKAVSPSTRELATHPEPGPSRSSSSSGRRPPAQVQGRRLASLH